MDPRQEYGEDRETVCPGTGETAFSGKYIQEIKILAVSAKPAG
jgi:hypothetical protein